jgi:hypothetical protein
MTTIDIRDFQIEPERGPDRPIIAYEVEDFIRRDGGHDYGAVIVRINVDGQFDLVQADLEQSGDLTIIDRAIAALTSVRAELASLYASHPRQPGRCLESGNWGRCKTTEGHEGDHVFPTEEEWSAEFRALSGARAAREARVTT